MGKRSREKREKRFLESREEKKYFYQSSLEKICLNIIKVGTYLILFTPLILSGRFFFPFVGPKSLYFMGLTEIIFFTWLFLIIFNPRYRPRFNLILGSLIFFLIVLIISAFLGVDPTYSFWSKFERMTGILMMLHLLAFFLVIFTVFQERDWIKIFSVSIFVGLILSLIAFVSKNPAIRGGATIGNESFLGTYLLFNLFLAFYLIFKSRSGLKIYSFVCFLIIALILLFSGARAAKLSFLGGLFLFFFLWLAFCQKGKLKWVGVSLLSFSIILSLSFFYFSFQPESLVRKEIIEKIVGETFGGRFIIWEKGWQGFLERPFFGWGPENFEFSYTKNYDPCMGTSRCGADIWYDRAHNIIFDTLVTTGILGILTYLGIFFSVFYLLWRRYFQQKVDPVRNSKIQKDAYHSNSLALNSKISNGVDFWTAGLFSVLLISYFVQNLTVFDMVSSYMIFFLVLGFVAHLNFQKKEPPVQKKIIPPKLLITTLLLILFIFSFFNFVIKPLKSDYYVIEALKAKNSNQHLLAMKKALEASPVGKNQIRTFFFEQLRDSFQKSKGSLAEEFQSELEFLSKELEKSIKESPLDFRSYLRLGELYNIWALTDSTKLGEAEKILKKALEISPTNQQAYWDLAQTKIYQGKGEEALSLVEQALVLEPRYGQSHLIVIQVAKLIGDEDLVKKKVEEALKIIPSLEPEIKKILEG